MFCREPYLPIDSTEEGCHAIRLKECGHIVGDACFADWQIHQPDSFAYWNHKLTLFTHTSVWAHDETDRIVILVRYLASSTFFRDDDIFATWLLYTAPEEIERTCGTWFHMVRIGLTNPRQNRLSLANAFHILSYYTVMPWFVLACLMTTAIFDAGYKMVLAGGILLYSAFFMPGPLFWTVGWVKFLINLTIGLHMVWFSGIILLVLLCAFRGQRKMARSI